MLGNSKKSFLQSWNNLYRLICYQWIIHICLVLLETPTNFISMHIVKRVKECFKKKGKNNKANPLLLLLEWYISLKSTERKKEGCIWPLYWLTHWSAQGKGKDTGLYRNLVFWKYWVYIPQWSHNISGLPTSMNLPLVFVSVLKTQKQL